jgi:hypothetical protein
MQFLPYRAAMLLPSANSTASAYPFNSFRGSITSALRLPAC